MLTGQQRRRTDDRDLLARERRDESRPQRDLGLAETDVAADQTIHRLAARQIVEHVGDRLQLIVGLGVGKAGAELLVGALRSLKHLAALDCALCRDLDQPIGHVGDALLQLRLARLPGDAAQAIEGGALLRRAIAAQHVDVLDRHEELVAAFVGQAQAVVPRVLDFQRHQPFVAADAVLAMDDEVAFAERRCLGDESLGRAALLLRPRQAIAENVLFGDDLEPFQHEAMLDRPDSDPERAGRKSGRGDVVGDRHRRRGAMLLQQMLEAGCRALGEAGDNHPPAGRLSGLHMLGHLVEQVHALRGTRLGEAFVASTAEIDGACRFRRGIEGGELPDRAAVEQCVPLRRLQIKLLRRHRLVVGAARHAAFCTGLQPRIVVVDDQLVARLECFHDLVVGRDHRFRAIVEQRLEMVVEQRQPVLHADMALPRRHRLVENVLAGHAAEQFAVSTAEAFDALGRQQHLADRKQHDLVAVSGRALAHRIERTDRLQRVAEQVEPQRLGGSGREQIDQAAAHGELARLHHGVGAAETVLAEEFRQPRHIDRLALAQRCGGLGIERPRRHLLQHRPRRSQDHARRHAGFPRCGQARECLQPLGDDVGMRRQPVVGQAVPGREHQHLAIGREEAQTVLQPLEPLAVARHMQDILSAGGPCELSQDPGVGALGQAGHGPAAHLAMQGGKTFAEGRRLGRH